MLHYQDPITEQQTSMAPQTQYHSVEFALNSPFPIYQYKLWRTSGNGVFLLVKNDSTLLPRLKVGNIVPMKYLGGNSMRHVEIRDTQIKKIVNERKGRFQGHYRVELAIVAPKGALTVQ